jgi:hypothetical protein
MDKCLEAFGLQKLNQEDISHLSSAIANNDTKTVIEPHNKEKPEI